MRQALGAGSKSDESTRPGVLIVGNHTVKHMGERRSPLFRARHFRDEIIVLCLRWYLRYPLSYRDLEEMMGERGLQLITPQSPAGCFGTLRC
jgi:hypothetical protein